MRLSSPKITRAKWTGGVGGPQADALSSNFSPAKKKKKNHLARPQLLGQNKRLWPSSMLVNKSGLLHTTVREESLSKHIKTGFPFLSSQRKAYCSLPLNNHMRSLLFKSKSTPTACSEQKRSQTTQKNQGLPYWFFFSLLNVSCFNFVVSLEIPRFKKNSRISFVKILWNTWLFQEKRQVY
jgi:hypothetical protein